MLAQCKILTSPCLGVHSLGPERRDQGVPKPLRVTAMSLLLTQCPRPLPTLRNDRMNYNHLISLIDTVDKERMPRP